MARYVVMDKATKMPSSCWGIYRKVAVVAVADDFCNTPSMISLRARGVIEIVELWDRLNVGTTERCAYRRALAEAEALAHELNLQASTT